MKQNIYLHLIGLSLLAFVLISMVIITSKQAEKTYQELVIHMPEVNQLVKEDAIIRLIENIVPKIAAMPIRTFSLSKIEQQLQTHPYIKKTHLFIDFNGKLKASIVQREPYLRIINREKQNYFIDKQGYKMPFLKRDVPHILIANGFINESYTRKDTLHQQLTKDLFTLTAFINHHKHTLWENQFQQLYVNERQEIILIPKIGNHKIVLGNIEDLAEKLNALFIFYKEALPRIGWDACQVINLQYTDQIICSKDPLP